jgi:hypothetical protein
VERSIGSLNLEWLEEGGSPSKKHRKKKTAVEVDGNEQSGVVAAYSEPVTASDETPPEKHRKRPGVDDAVEEVPPDIPAGEATPPKKHRKRGQSSLDVTGEMPEEGGAPDGPDVPVPLQIPPPPSPSRLARDGSSPRFMISSVFSWSDIKLDPADQEDTAEGGSPRKPRMTRAQGMELAIQRFPTDPIKALKLAAATRHRLATIAESAAILTTVPGFDPADVSAFLLRPPSTGVLRASLASLLVPGDFVTSLRRCLGGTPLWVPDDPDSLERVLEFLMDFFIPKSPGVFEAATDGVLVALALLLASGQTAVTTADITRRLATLMEGKAPTEAQCAEWLATVAAQPFPRRPANPAPRYRGWVRLRIGKGPAKGTVAYVLMNSLCLFCFKDDSQFEVPHAVVHLFGFELHPDENDPLKIVLVATKPLAVANYDKGKVKAMSGVKKVELTSKTAEFTKKWVVKLRRVLLLGLFVPAREPLDIPAIEVPPLPGRR